MRVFYTMNPNFDLPKTLLVRGINHVLRREEWALRELKQHQGKVIRLVLPVSETWIQISAIGEIDLTRAEIESANLTLEISNESLMRVGESTGSIQERVVKAVNIAGDAELAQLIAKLARQLRWEYEEDLAEIIGDAPAHGLGQAARGMASALRKFVGAASNGLPKAPT